MVKHYGREAEMVGNPYMNSALKYLHRTHYTRRYGTGTRKFTEYFRIVPFSH